MNRSLGLTLIELLLTVTILAVLAAVAAPPLSEFVDRYRSEAKARELFDIIILMRTKAFGEGQAYTLCPSANSNDCGGNWTDGALLFMDANRNGKREVEEPVERVFSRLRSSASLQWKGFNYRGYLQFRPNGRTASQSGYFAYCPPDRSPGKGWTIVLNATGRPYFGLDSDGDGTPESGSGKNLSCSG